MKSKKDKIIVAVTGVALTIVFLVALIIGDASGIKVDDSTSKTKEQVADQGETSDTSEGVVAGTEENSTSQVAEQSTEPSTEQAGSEEATSAQEQTTEPVQETQIFLVNLSDYVYVRAAASKDAEILGKVYARGGGEVIEYGSEWTKIKSGNVEGYVYTDYIWVGEEAEANLPTYGKKIGTVTTSDLRVRDAASTNSEVLGYLDMNAEVEVVEEGAEWHKIEFEGDDAYISAEYVTIRYEYSLGVTVAEEEAAIKAEEERLAAIAAEEQRKAEEEAALLAQAVAEAKVVEIVRTPAYTGISDEDIYLMMCVVSKECGYDCYEGQLAVANIILNRYNGKGYGDTVKDVLYAPNQFSVVTWDSFQTVIAEGPKDSARQAVEEALSGVNNVPNYTNYRSLSGMTAEDYEGMAEYSIIGNQVFYRRK